jgi:hypothetical protein
MRLPRVIVAVSILVACPWQARLVGQQARAVGAFDLTVTRSPVLTPGQYHVDAKTVTIVVTSVARGRLRALRVEMQGTEKGLARFVFLLDTANHVTQADLSIAVPGRVASRTIAWSPSGISKYFADFRYDGQRLHLVSRGTYDSSADTPTESLLMAWDVDIDAAVTRGPDSGLR